MIKGPLKLLGLLVLAVGTLFLVPALASCGGTSVLTTPGPSAPPPAPLPMPTDTPAAPTPAVDPATVPAQVPDTSNDDGDPDEGGVTPGTFCSTGGDIGHHGGHLYTCKGPGPLRWRR